MKLEADRLTQAFEEGNGKEIPPHYLPVKSVIEVLENEPRLRVPRSQTMGMISLSDCYDTTGKVLFTPHYPFNTQPYQHTLQHTLSIQYNAV